MHLGRMVVLSLVLQVGLGSAHAALKSGRARPGAPISLATGTHPHRPRGTSPAAVDIAAGRARAQVSVAAKTRTASRPARQAKRAVTWGKVKVAAGLTALGAGLIAAVGGPITAIAVALSDGPTQVIGAALVGMVAGIATVTAIISRMING